MMDDNKQRRERQKNEEVLTYVIKGMKGNTIEFDEKRESESESRALSKGERKGFYEEAILHTI